MWESDRKYTIPGSTNVYGNKSYMNTEDLHAWSIYRQNLNADLSESAIGISKSSNTERPFGNFQLRETTVKNILNHPKYGARLREQDPATYLRYGLPRVKMSQSEIGIGKKRNGVINRNYHHNESPSGSEDDRDLCITNGEHIIGDRLENDVRNVNNVRRTWKSDPDLLRSSDHIDYKHTNSKYLAPTFNSKAISETDLRFTSTNGHSKINHNINNNGSPYDGMEMNGLPPKHPHLIVRGLYYELDKTSTCKRFCGAQRTKLKLLDNISFEVRAGEILAIMTTNEAEGTSILDILTNRYNKMESNMKGDITLNGLFMTPKRLSQIIAYVSQDCTLCPDMSTRQTLLFTSLLQGPAKKNSFDTKKRTNAVLEELGLSEVRHTKVGDLTEAEKRRLLIAINLILDTDILLLDQPTKGMDIFDSFFLIEYLRQWALISGRCVIITIQPATYEIFTMISRIVLISTGRVLYFGKRHDLLSYFSYIDFPCPAFKNPSDYYLDLVTLDNLSSEAMLESSQRIENLVDLYARRCSNSVSLPDPPSITPSPIKKANFPIMFLSLWIRALIFTFPYNVIHTVRNIFISLCLSIMTGIIYWHIRTGEEQEDVWDRIGLQHTILAIMPIPLFLVIINDIHKEKDYVLNEIKLGLYTKSAYLCSKMLYSLPKDTLVFIFYALPISSITGFQNYMLLYLTIMLSYLHTMRIIAISSAWACNKRSIAAIMFGIIFTILTLSSGTTFHVKDLSIVTRWINSFSLIKHAHESLITMEFADNTTSGYGGGAFNFICNINPVIQQQHAILIRAECGLQNRENILKWFNYKGGKSSEMTRSIFEPLLSFAIGYIIFLVIAIFSFCTLSRRKSSNLQKSG